MKMRMRRLLRAAATFDPFGPYYGAGSSSR
jgi:hypothetical protein